MRTRKRRSAIVISYRELPGIRCDIPNHVITSSRFAKYPQLHFISTCELAHTQRLKFRVIFYVLLRPLADDADRNRRA